MTWPKPGEDQHLAKYWADKGTLFTEVPLAAGHWPTRPWGAENSEERRLDGVLWPEGPDRRIAGVRFEKHVEDMRDASVELVEVKKALNFGVIGQALVGRWLFEQQIGRPHGIKVAKNTVLVRAEDPALVWAADELRLVRENAMPPLSGAEKRGTRKQYTLREPILERLRAFRADAPGRYLARVPLAGPGSPWEGSLPTFIPFLRVAGAKGRTVEIYEPAFESLLRDKTVPLEQIIVNRRQRPSRGNMGTVACTAKLFKRRYGRSLSRFVIVSRKRDAALEAAITGVAKQRRLPPVEFVTLEG